MENEYELSFPAKEIDERLTKAGSAVLYTQQTLTEEQKAQARENIGALGEEDKYKTLADYAGYVRGTLNAGVYDKYIEYRVVSNNYMRFDSNVTLEITKDAYRFAVSGFADDDSMNLDSGWMQDSYYVPAGTRFKIVIARDLPETTERADIELFASAVKAIGLPLEEKTQGVATTSNSALNIFNLPLYHHMNQEVYQNCNIPAESLYDIHYARTLGFNMIEANPIGCSDGVYLVKHGSQGKMGAGLTVADGSDCSETLFSSVTSTWVRENVRYNSALDKYKGVIPTMDEFCAECKKLNMMVKILGTEPLQIARKYLPDDMIWLTIYSGERPDGFTGTIEYVWYPTKNINVAINECKEIGAPLNIVIAAGEFDALEDATIVELCTKAHANGFTVGVVYPTSTSLLRAFRLGVDCAGATSNNVNFLSCGNEKNIVDLDSSELTQTNASYDDTNDVITITNGGSVVVSGDEFRGGITSLRIRYQGVLTIYNNEKKNYLDSYESDGSNVVEYSTVIQPKGTAKYTRWLTIEANADTIIYDIELHCSRI